MGSPQRRGSRSGWDDRIRGTRARLARLASDGRRLTAEGISVEEPVAEPTPCPKTQTGTKGVPTRPIQPDFSFHHLLRGPDEMAIRSAFGTAALAYFGVERGWHVEVASGNIGVYRSGKRCRPEELTAFRDEALGRG